MVIQHVLKSLRIWISAWGQQSQNTGVYCPLFLESPWGFQASVPMLEDIGPKFSTRLELSTYYTRGDPWPWEYLFQELTGPESVCWQAFRCGQDSSAWFGSAIYCWEVYHCKKTLLTRACWDKSCRPIPCWGIYVLFQWLCTQLCKSIPWTKAQLESQTSPCTYSLKNSCMCSNLKEQQGCPWQLPTLQNFKNACGLTKMNCLNKRR